jgi:hypothetical protein
VAQFYDRTCINEQMKMQRNLTREQMIEMGKQMSGVEYQLHSAQEVPGPPQQAPAHSLFVIRKVRREAAAKPGAREPCPLRRSAERRVRNHQA